MKKDAYICNRGDNIFIGNHRLELGFDQQNRAALISIVDKTSGWEFVRDTTAAFKTLFQLVLRGDADKMDWLDSNQANRVPCDALHREHGETLVFTATEFPAPHQHVVVRVEVSLEDDSPHSSWRMTVSGVAEGYAVHALSCPVVAGVCKVGDPAPGEAIAIPRHSQGYVFKNPFPVQDQLPLRAGRGTSSPAVGIGQFSQIYPGVSSMQFMLYYNDMAGLYFACHDDQLHVKRFACETWEDKYPTFIISHLPPEDNGQVAEFSYETVLGVFNGDWQDGAELYKSWARRQWWCDKTLAERDIAPGMREGFAVWQMSNYNMPEIKLNHSMQTIATTVNNVSAETGVPFLGLVFNFEKEGAWTAPKGFFPPREGEVAFRLSMEEMRGAGNHGFVYIPGGQWYVSIGGYKPPFDSRQAFASEGEPNAITSHSGEKSALYNERLQWYGARMCPSTAYVQQMTEDLLLGCLRLGCDIVQIDNFPCVSPESCFNPQHAHPPGFGPWYTKAWIEMLTNIRSKAKSMNSACAITSESIAECYIPWLDFYDQRAANVEYWHRLPSDPAHGEAIPLFGYVYGGYIGAYLAAFPECNRPEIQYWTRCFGKALAQGVVPTGGRYYPEPGESNPLTYEFFKKTARAAARECWKYIMFGEMLKSPIINSPKVDAVYLPFSPGYECLETESPQFLQDDAIQCSAWKAADGAKALFFINISQTPVTFTAAVPDWAGGADQYDVDMLLDGERTQLFSAVCLPPTLDIDSPPLSVMVVEARLHLPS